MSVVEKLNDRIRSKITPETSARIEAIREKENGADIHDSMRAFSGRAVAELATRKQAEEAAAPGMRM
ncbi:hypothetical protein D3C87_1785460 [compost metagenome]